MDSAIRIAKHLWNMRDRGSGLSRLKRVIVEGQGQQVRAIASSFQVFKIFR